MGGIFDFEAARGVLQQERDAPEVGMRGDAHDLVVQDRGGRYATI